MSYVIVLVLSLFFQNANRQYYRYVSAAVNYWKTSSTIHVLLLMSSRRAAYNDLKAQTINVIL